MAFYVKKETPPVEALQLKQNNQDEIMRFCCGRKGLDGTVIVPTKEGDLRAVSGDFIISTQT